MSDAIEITVKADGSIIATTHNVTGSACLDYIAVLEDLLEAQTVQSRFTDEFLQNTVVHDSSRVIQPNIQKDGLGGNV